jgi:hypothetical protein
VAVMHLILAGLPARYPWMRVLASHPGGALPLLPRRLDDPPGLRVPPNARAALGRRPPPLVRHGQPCASAGTGRRGGVLRGGPPRPRHGLPLRGRGGLPAGRGPHRRLGASPRRKPR